MAQYHTPSKIASCSIQSTAIFFTKIHAHVNNMFSYINVNFYGLWPSAKYKQARQIAWIFTTNENIYQTTKNKATSKLYFKLFNIFLIVWVKFYIDIFYIYGDFFSKGMMHD